MSDTVQFIVQDVVVPRGGETLSEFAALRRD